MKCASAGAWSASERFYLPDGASFYFDTGHFALETHCDEIAAAILSAGVEVRAPRGDEAVQEP